MQVVKNVRMNVEDQKTSSRAIRKRISLTLELAEIEVIDGKIVETSTDEVQTEDVLLFAGLKPILDDDLEG